MERLPFAIVIPARLESTRLPRKLLLDDTGQPLIRHTVEAANAMGADVVAVTSNDREILDSVDDLCLTIGSAKCHRNGSERVAEAMNHPDLASYDVLVNVQGDEPELPPEAARLAVEALEYANLGTIGSAPLKERQPGVRIHSRPNRRNAMTPYARNFTRVGRGRLHHGVYAYRRATLKWYASVEQTRGEVQNSLEQLRFIEYGRTVAYKMIDGATARHPVDDPKTYEAFVRRFSRQM